MLKLPEDFILAEPQQPIRLKEPLRKVAKALLLGMTF